MAAGTPYLDFGRLKSLDSHGFGFVHSFAMDRDVRFHISAVTDRKLRAYIDQRQQFEDLKLWWLVELVPQRSNPDERKFEAVAIWESLQEAPPAYRCTFVERAVSYLGDSELTPERIDVLTHLLQMPELDRSDIAKVLSWRAICANPHKIIHLLTPEQRAELRPHLQLLAHWRDIEHIPPSWLEEITAEFYGLDTLRRLKQGREEGEAQSDQHLKDFVARRLTPPALPLDFQLEEPSKLVFVIEKEIREKYGPRGLVRWQQDFKPAMLESCNKLGVQRQKGNSNSGNNSVRNRNNFGSNRKTTGLLESEKSWNDTGPIPRGYVRPSAYIGGASTVTRKALGFHRIRIDAISAATYGTAAVVTTGPHVLVGWTAAIRKWTSASAAVDTTAKSAASASATLIGG